MFNCLVKIALLASWTTLTLGAPARADITVGTHLRWGSLTLIGQKNPGDADSSSIDDDELLGQKPDPDADFTLVPFTEGTSSENGGQISGHLNRKIRLLAGQYEINFSQMTYEIEVREGESTVIKLRKVTPAHIDGTDSVTLTYDGEDDSDDSAVLARWERLGERSVPVYYCERPWFGGSGPIEGGCAEGGKKWVAGHRSVKFKRPWTSAVFYVLPGDYAIEWNLKDGSTHRESKIRVN
jgi:hypothetical protein